MSVRSTVRCTKHPDNPSSEHVNSRYLIIEISIENANRAGALANTTVGEYSRMAKESDEFVLLVKKHKTVSTHGPARTVFSPGSPFEICCF